jgi:hypothetical protein
MESGGGVDASPGSVSASSSEGEIRDRLRLGLQQDLRLSCEDVAPKESHPALFMAPSLDLCVMESKPTASLVPRLDLGIPTPVRSRLSASSMVELSDSDDSDDDEGDDAFTEMTAKQMCFPPQAPLASVFMPPPTPRRR